jgi:hypothetical protein
MDAPWGMGSCGSAEGERMIFLDGDREHPVGAGKRS